MADQKPAGWYVGLHYLRIPGETECHGWRPGPQMMEPTKKPTDFIYVDQFLGQLENWDLYLRSWFKFLKVGGCMVICIPDVRYKDSPGKLHNGAILDAMKSEDAECLEDDVLNGDSFIVLRKRLGSGFQYRPWRKKPKHVLVSRFGAFGDALMVASILPRLKEEGWTVTMNAMERGEEALRHDPHIDEWLAIAGGQIPEQEMSAYWNAIQTRYDRFINMTHSVEGYHLKQEWRGDFYWAEDARRRLCSGSYLEHTHLVAGVKGPYRVKFYPNEEEKVWAEKKAEEIGPFILWCLNGSAPHKWYPHVSKVIVRLLIKTGLNLVLVGGLQSKQQEGEIYHTVNEYIGAEGTKRIFSLVDTKSVRQAMCLAQKAALVFGPETGVLNAVCLEDVPKVCLLSHSAKSNLTDDWKNTVAVVPDVPCYPCHRLHNSHVYCPQDKVTQAALCAATVAPDKIEQAISEALRMNAGQAAAA